MPDFNQKRETTLGYFSVPQPFEIGKECFRFTAKQTLGSTDKVKAVRLKSYLNGDTMVSELDKSSVSALDESTTMHAGNDMRGTEYSGKAGSKNWLSNNRFGSTDMNAGAHLKIRKPISSRDLSPTF